MSEFENNQNFQDSPDPNTQSENINTSYTEADSLPKQEPHLTPTYTTPYNNYSIPKKQKNTHSTAVVIVSCILAALIGAASAVVIIKNPLFINTETSQSEYKQQSNKVETQNKEENKPQNNININVEESASSIAEAVAKKCSNSVVGIRTTSSVTSFFGGTQEQSGDGSGVIYSEDGYIITNYHVISNALTAQNPKIDVFVGDSQSDSYSATVIGYNISCDLAVIKIDANNLVPIEFANSDELQVGQNVVTIGAPGGLEFMGSVTYGIISGLDRTVSTSAGLKLIQTDAAINPGNSGGALLNSEGKLVGINSSKIASVEYEGMGFAIPVNTVKEKCNKIISHQGDSGAYLGVSVSSTYTSEVLNYYGFPAGAVVSSVFEGSPAEKAGIKRGDIITEFNGVEISEYTILGDTLYDCEPNDTVSIVIYRNGKNYTVKVKLTSDTSN